jgi:type VI secretion system protein ImpH
MASQGGQLAAALIEELFSSPQRFTFVAAVRVLEQTRRLEAARRRDCGSESTPPPGSESELVRFRAAATLSFPRTEIDDLRPPQGDAPAEIEVCFLGLNGFSGVLPRFYSELVLQQLKLKNLALRDFLDILNHRAIRNHLDAARKYRLPAAFELAEGLYADPISGALRALIGMATPRLAFDAATAGQRLAVTDAALLSYAGLLSRKVRSAAGLQQMLCDFVGRPVEVVQLTGSWARLDPDDQTCLASADRPGGNYAELGVNAMLGTQIYDVQGSFRVELGPLDYAAFRDLLPGTPLMQEIAALTRFYAGPTLGFEVRLLLRYASVPLCVLGGEGDFSPVLGLNTWLFTSARSADAADVCVRFEQLESADSDSSPSAAVRC